MTKLLTFFSVLLFVAACVPASIAPSAPTGVTATATSKSTIDVSWAAVSGATSYTVWDDAGILKATVSSSILTATVSTLSSHTTYTYKVKATNSAGTSAFSSTASDTTFVSYSADINVNNDGTKGCLGCHGAGAVNHFDQAYQTAWGNDATWLSCVTTNGADCSSGGGMGWADDASHRVLIRDWKAEGFDHTN